MIRAEHVSYSYNGNGQTVTDLSFHIEKGEFVAVLGENGAGKTTTVKLIDGLLKPTSGTMTVNGLDTAKSKVSERAKHVGFLFQNPDRQIFTLLRTLNREYGMTVVVVEQKIMLLCEFAERLAVLSEGRIVREGTVRDVLGDIAGLEEIGVNCPRSALFSSLLAEKTGREIPVCVNADEAVDTARRLIG